ncbi:MAG TPA: inositol monophosphatase family protein [Planctomycetaceae bacterium]|nr:inositol monophosphatase family protein [Planctomycetaceae bacterium]
MSDFELLATAEEAAREAGALLRNWSRQLQVNEKTGPADLVTEADVAAQKLIFDLIHARYPDHNFLGEEGLNKTDGQSEYRWVIDPLDGTSNYVHGYPYYAVSIGLERAGELLLGTIYDPTRDETFSALAGHGAKLNGQSIHVSRITELKHAMVIASFPPGVNPESPPIARFMRVLPHAQTIHRTGSAALNLAYLAAGRIEAFWSSSLKPWDMAAGVAIVREAGGRVTRMDGGPLDLAVPDMLASNGSEVHAQLERLLD